MRYGLNDTGPNLTDDRTGFPSQSTVLDELAILQRVVSLYDIPDAQSCRFLSRGDADIYRVNSGDLRFYLKIYRPPHTHDAAEDEARFVHTLAEKEVSVVQPIPLKSGDFSIVIKASEGIRPCLLFEEAPKGTFNEINSHNYENFGMSVARLHNAADSINQRFKLTDCYSELQNPPMLKYISDYVPDSDYEHIEALHARMRNRLGELSRSNPDFGLCHMDLVMSNVRMNENNEVVFFDFGNAGYCWRIADMAVVKWVLKRQQGDDEDLWRAFLSGYSKIRNLPDNLQDTLPWFEMWRVMNFLAGNAASLPLRLGLESMDGDFMGKGIEALNKIEEEIGS